MYLLMCVCSQYVKCLRLMFLFLFTHASVSIRTIFTTGNSANGRVLGRRPLVLVAWRSNPREFGRSRRLLTSCWRWPPMRRLPHVPWPHKLKVGTGMHAVRCDATRSTAWNFYVEVRFRFCSNERMRYGRYAFWLICECWLGHKFSHGIYK